MADLNALIAQGYQFQPLPDPFAQYGKMQQLQNAGIQNQLTQQQLAAAQRAEMQTNALNQAYSSAINPDTGEIDYASLRKAMASGGAGSQIPGIEKLRLEAEKAGLEKQKLQGELAAQPVALAGAKSKVIDEQLKRSKELLDQINPNNPNVRDQLMAWHQGNHTGYLGELLKSQGSTPEKTMADIDAAVAGGPKGISDFISRSVEGTQAFQKKIAPMPKEVNDGKVKFLRDENPLSPTYLQEIPGSRTTLQMSLYEDKHLQFLKDKEEFDQNNPGFELKEITQRDGTTKTVKVNKKTGAYSDVVSEGPGGTPLTGVSIPAQDLDFRKQKDAFERNHPTLSIQQVNQSDGSAIVVAVNTRDATYQPVVSQGDTFVPAGPAMPISGGMPSAAAPLAAPSAAPSAAVVDNALVGGAVNNAFVSGPNGAGRPLISAAKPVAPPADQALMTALGFPLTTAGYTAFKDAQRQDRLLNPAEEAQKIRIANASRPPGAAKDDPNITVASTQVDSAGNVTFYNKFGKPISTQKGAGKPSATFEKTAASKVNLARDLDRAIAELTAVTKDGGLIDQSTGSGVGRVVDLGARFIGKAMPGDIAIGKLQPVADLALKMVPRFEGPQSNADTTSYNQAAGQLADPTLPPEIRKAAGKTVLRLMIARKGQFRTADIPTEGAEAAPTGVDTRNPLLN